MIDCVSVEEAFGATCLYMRRWWERDHDVGVASILAFWERGESHQVDPAIWAEWVACIDEVARLRGDDPRRYGVHLRRDDGATTVRVAPASEPRPSDDVLHERMSVREALDAAVLYLQTWAGRFKGTPLHEVLSASQLVGEGSTLDPAAWHDWIQGVRRIVGRR